MFKKVWDSVYGDFQWWKYSFFLHKKGFSIIYFPEKTEKVLEGIVYIIEYLFSSIAQWQSTRLLTVGLLVRAQLGELWRHSQAVRRGSATPWSSVQIRLSPLICVKALKSKKDLGVFYMSLWNEKFSIKGTFRVRVLW